MNRRTWLAAGLVTAAAVAAVTVPAQAAPPANAPGTGVTLLTGDTVTVLGDKARVTPARGREEMPFRQYTDERGDLHVVPTDVQHLISARKLDPRLFDVTELIRSGYDDARSEIIPLIIQGGVTARGGKALSSIGATAVKASKKDFWGSVRADTDQTIWLDGKVKASLDRSVPQVGAPQAWQAGHTGKGTTVAVLDTGLDPTHADLAGAVTDAKDFSESPSGTDDLIGHGTHVASTITGDGRYKGVAPDAELLVGKVLDDYGSGSESMIIAGMEWAAAAGANVVNMSLGSRWPSDGTDPMSQAVNRITEQTGTLFVVAAGNSGPRDESIGSPAAADLALTVGAVDRQDDLAEFSSRGPRWVDGAIKPDITAPGVDIVAARAAHGQIGTPVGDKHVALSGTSMATPHVAGAAAILAGQHPDWTPARLKAALMNSATPNPSLSVYEQGAGRLDVARAVSQAVTADVGGLSLGTALWPHHDDAPIEKTVTYRNAGTAPVTLNVTGSLTDPAGKPAVAGMVGVSPATVTVPAGGEAAVKLTVRTAIEAPDGIYGGALVASDGTLSVRTPIGVTKEVESYHVKLSFVDYTGAPTDRYSYRFVAHERAKAYLLHDPSGTVVQRIPKGKYYVETSIQGADRQTTEIVEPAFEVVSDTTITFDARVGEQPGFTVDKPKAKPALASLGFTMTMPWGRIGHGITGPDFEGFLVRPARTSAPGAFQYDAQAVMGEPDGNGGFAGSPYAYHLRFTHPDTVPSGLNRKVSDSSLAVVHTTTASHGSGATALKNDAAKGPMPLRVTEYYTPDTPWHGSVIEFEGSRPVPPTIRASQLAIVPRTYRLGRPTTERWNQAVFGPAFPWLSDRAYEWAGRKGDEVAIRVPMFADQSSRNMGYSSYSAARTTLSRNGSVVLEAQSPGYVHGKVPADKAEYRLHTESDNTFTELSTKVSADWTFSSGTVTGDPAALPLLAVRFAPSLDDHNKTSYDDGTTWKPIHVVRHGDKWTALLVHPKDAKYVSLKAQARDSAGNAVDQTIIRAYGLR